MIKVGDLVRWKIGKVRSYHTDCKRDAAKRRLPLLVVEAKERLCYQFNGQEIPGYVELKLLCPDGTIATAKNYDVTARMK